MRQIANAFNRLSLRKSNKKKGMSVVEAIAALLILTLSVMVMARLTALKMSEQTTLEDQYIVNNVDAYFSYIYSDFHNCQSLKIEETDDGSGLGTVMLTFVMRDTALGSIIYSYEEQTGYCYRNGIQHFKCNSFDVAGSIQNLSVSIKLPNEKRMEMNIFR